MAKIDVTKIEGYENMTAEEKLAVLEGFEYDDNTSELERYKNAVSKANSEAAELKRKYNERLSAEEKEKNERDEELKNLRSKVADLEKKDAISNHKARFLGLGYEEALAEATAIALAEGDMDSFFANQKKHNETREKTIKADLLKKTPTPPTGEGKVMSKDDIMKITDNSERQRIIAENIELFNEN